MAVITYLGTDYTVDHAVKGADYIHGYDANSVMIVSFEGISDFSLFSYNGNYMAPDHCLAEGCNDVKFVGGVWQTRDGSPLLRTATITLPAASWADNGNEIFTQNVVVGGGTTNTLAALQPSDMQFMMLMEDGVSFLKVDNLNGVFTAKAGSAAPSTDMTIQATLTEVVV